MKLKEFTDKTCPVCKGKGTVPNGSKWGSPHTGQLTGYNCPVRAGGHTGEIMADPKLSYCAKCHGTGMKLVTL